MTLAQQVDRLARRAHHLEGLAGEMLSTIKMNLERGYITAVNDEGKLNLTKIVARWSKQLADLEREGT